MREVGGGVAAPPRCFNASSTRHTHTLPRTWAFLPVNPFHLAFRFGALRGVYQLYVCTGNRYRAATLSSGVCQGRWLAVAWRAALG